MAGGLKKFFDFMKLGNEEDDYLDDDSYEEDEEEPKRRKRSYSSEESQEPERKRSRYSSESDDSSRPRRDYGSTAKSAPSKVVPMKSSVKGSEVTIQKPTSFEDAEMLCDMLLKGQAVVVNLEGFDSGDAQRIIDLLYGCIYAIGGKLNQISKYIFIFSPENVDVDGDLTFDVNGVPTFKNEF